MNYTNEQIANIAKAYAEIKYSTSYIASFVTNISAIGIDSPSFEAVLAKFERIARFKRDVPVEVQELLEINELEEICDRALRLIHPEDVERLKARLPFKREP